MKRYLFFVLLCAAVLLVAAPLLAARPEPVGGRINVLAGNPSEYEAGEPFHIVHGWALENFDYPPGRYGFQLDVDGTYLTEDHRFIEGGGPDFAQVRTWLFNFPDGMSDVHTFTGHWWVPCADAVDNYGYQGTCVTGAQIIEVETYSLEVTFTP